MKLMMEEIYKKSWIFLSKLIADKNKNFPAQLNYFTFLICFIFIFVENRFFHTVIPITVPPFPIPL